MKLMTLRMQILGIIETWKANRLTYRSSEEGKAELAKLKAIDLSTVTIERIVNIIKIESRYIRPQLCSECHKYCEILVHVGEELDYESETAYLCKECLEKAFNLIKDALYE